jgi:glycosyltransferase involved in cell wall biosynthesis
MTALHERGHEIHYVSLDPPPKHVTSSIIWHRIPFWTQKRSGLFFWGTFTLYLPFFLNQIAREIKPDRLVSFGAYYAKALLPAKGSQKIKLILFLRSLVFKTDRIKKRNPILRLFTEAGDKKGILGADHVVFMTHSMEEEAQIFVKSEVLSKAIIPNDVIIKKTIKEIPQGKPIKVLMTGVFDQGKNISFVITALKRLPAEIQKKYTVTLVGAGPAMSSIRDQIAGLPSLNAQVLGWQDNFDNLLEETDLFIHPSMSEGVSNSLTEALGYGIPVIASDIPEHRDIFKSELNLFPIDEPSKLTELLSRISSDRNIAQDIALASAQAAKALSFDWNSRMCAEVLR